MDGDGGGGGGMSAMYTGAGAQTRGHYCRPSIRLLRQLTCLYKAGEGGLVAISSSVAVKTLPVVGCVCVCEFFGDDKLCAMWNVC